MGTKIGIAIGLGVGFVLGAKAGHERYSQIKGAASRMRDVPIVARPLDAAGEKVADVVRLKGEEIADAVAEAVKEKLFGVRSTDKTELQTEEIVIAGADGTFINEPALINEPGLMVEAPEEMPPSYAPKNTKTTSKGRFRLFRG